MPITSGVNPLADDLDLILTHTEELWEAMRGERLFVTGGTGFFGTWLLESFCWANAKLRLGAKALVLTRDPDAFAHKASHLAADPAISFLTGDVRDFAFPTGEFAHVIHAASETTASAIQREPLDMLDTIVSGTRRVLDFSLGAGVRNLLYVSSGAVYGRIPADCEAVPEDYTGGPDVANADSTYGEAKRLAELLCAIYHRQYGLPVKIARGFAFVGPHLPLDAHFAIGNFILACLEGRDIVLTGDGSATRSYLYAADTAIWLWTILFRGQPALPINVGSSEAISVLELAEAVKEATGADVNVRIPNPGRQQAVRNRYVPTVTRAADQLSLQVWTPLRDSIRKTAGWYQRYGGIANQPTRTS